MAQINIPFPAGLVDAVRKLFSTTAKMNDFMMDISTSFVRESKLPTIFLSPAEANARYQKFSQGLRSFETHLQRSTEFLLRPLSTTARLMFRTMDVTRILTRVEGLMGTAQLVPLSG